MRKDHYILHEVYSIQFHTKGDPGVPVDRFIFLAVDSFHPLVHTPPILFAHEKFHLITSIHFACVIRVIPFGHSIHNGSSL